MHHGVIAADTCKVYCTASSSVAMQLRLSSVVFRTVAMTQQMCVGPLSRHGAHFANIVFESLKV